ncbi:hypothetical protein GWO43_01255 [candidate division KSB1 bacterium]|nr:hypothetical protein [candidate division KSB1 bacterium]NIS22698.1 hypothetical protein [candidate division KSB1 bacterium]NIT69546.1 hypothetical protein [candidate division KSB1 bacterium]NIU23200.1 hypothetical protein [candidate division KSB1 bacterium]NIU90362.1 hypothetical protein [candidate division KSB1 bacterium]
MAQAEQVINYLFTRSQMLGQIPPEILSQTPEILFKVDFQKVEDLIADSMGISDLGIFRSEEEVNDKVIEFQRVQQAQQQLQGLQQGAGAVKDLATAQKVAQGG